MAQATAREAKTRCYVFDRSDARYGRVWTTLKRRLGVFGQAREHFPETRRRNRGQMSLGTSGCD